MKNQIKPRNAPWKLPLLAVIAVLMILAMLRLGVWQLSRAAEKQVIVDQLMLKNEMPALSFSELLVSMNDKELRFRKIKLKGRYDVENTIYIDNQVVNGQVGYQVFTPFMVENSPLAIMVARGFIGIGSTRKVLPKVNTISTELSIEGRLNVPPAKPPLWSDDYPVVDGARWQFLPISDLAEQLHLDLFPLVVELAPIKAKENVSSDGLVRQWSVIDDQWVAKHQGYAFQWFAMAAAFFVACLVLLLRTISRKT